MTRDASNSTRAPNQPYQSQYHDPSSNLWSIYLSKAENYDRTMAQHWKGDMDTILIFAGLFSASVTAFIIESYKTLRPDDSVQLLAVIASQLSNNRTSATPNVQILANSETFTPSLSAIVCNVFWFLSLSLSLICALSATLVEQWTRHYLQSPYNCPAPQDRARISAYLFQGTKKYRMAVIVETIPMLLHLALFLFFAGLIAFLGNVNTLITYIIAGLLALCIALYWFISTLPIFHLASPYWTPLSSLTWYILRKLRLLHRRDAKGDRIPITCSLQTAQELDATEITPQRDQRDLKAMCWTISALRDEDAFEPFVEVIPSVVSGIDYSAKWLMDALLRHEDVAIKLDFRILRLLTSCLAGSLDGSIAQRRIITCLRAIWSLTMLSLPNQGPLNQQEPRETSRFKEDTLNLLLRVKKLSPANAIQDHIPSVLVVVARSLLDSQMEEVDELEANVMLSVFSNRHEHISSTRRSGTESYSGPLTNRILALEERIIDCQTLTVPDFHLSVRSVVMFNRQLVSQLLRTPAQPDSQRTQDILRSLRRCRAIINQAGLNLALEYVDQILQLNTLPHESFNTLRRAFFRIQFDKSNLPTFLEQEEAFTNADTPSDSFNSTTNIAQRTDFSLASQERLLAYLKEATDHSHQGSPQSTRLPSTIISILVSLARALSKPRLLVKAIKIIEDYRNRYPQEEDISAGALRSILQSLPPESPDSVSTGSDKDSYSDSPGAADPSLGHVQLEGGGLSSNGGPDSEAQRDLLRSHIYADAKPPKQTTPGISRDSTLWTIS